MNRKTVIARSIFCVSILQQLISTHCVIDMDQSTFSYIANHLSRTECRKLIASLQSLDYRLPSNLSDAAKKVPKDKSCIKLLLSWNSGVKPTDGKGRSHVDVAHRLRQLNKRELANWLGKTVFCQLAIDIEEVLNSYPFQANEINKPNKHLENEVRIHTEVWTIYDVVLWIGVIAGLCAAFFEVVWYRVKKRCAGNQCELEDLLIRDNFDSDDDYVSENMFYNSIENDED